MELSKKQKKELFELEQWFEAQIQALKRKEAEIIKDYDNKKIKMIQKHISAKIDNK